MCISDIRASTKTDPALHTLHSQPDSPSTPTRPKIDLKVAINSGKVAHMNPFKNRRLPTRIEQYCLVGLLLVMALLLSPHPADAEWIALEKRHQPQGKQTVYYDPSSISREGNWVTAWQLTNTAWMGEPPTPRFLSVKTHKQFDCPRWQFRVLAVIQFSRQMAKGKSNSGYIENGSWQKIDSESPEQGLGEIVCRTP